MNTYPEMDAEFRAMVLEWVAEEPMLAGRGEELLAALAPLDMEEVGRRVATYGPDAFVAIMAAHRVAG